VLAALEDLPPDQREAIALHALECLTYAEAATVLDRPVNTVKTLVRRGRLRLADALHHDAEAPHGLHR
jgi:RNA polymerase sigma-70 factor (ECF subfamily)